MHDVDTRRIDNIPKAVMMEHRPDFFTDLTAAIGDHESYTGKIQIGHAAS